MNAPIVAYNRTVKELLAMIGKKITLTDSRTGARYTTTIDDVKTAWGNDRVSVDGGNTWFEPTGTELRSVK